MGHPADNAAGEKSHDYRGGCKCTPGAGAARECVEI
jgi:hypothetical protein